MNINSNVFLSDVTAFFQYSPPIIFYRTFGFSDIFTMSSNTTVVQSSEPMSSLILYGLIQFGVVFTFLLPEPYRSLKMREIIPFIAHPNTTEPPKPFLPPVNVTLMAPYLHMSPEKITGSVLALDKFLSSDAAQSPGHQGDIVRVGAIAFTIFALITVAIRFYARVYVTKQLKVYDWLVLFALVASFGQSAILVYVSEVHGLASHVWFISYDDIISILKFIIAGGTLYLFGSNAVKISLILFYKQLIPHRFFRILCHFASFLVLAHVIIGTYFIFFQCRPLDYWNRIQNVDAKCLPRLKIYKFSAIFQLITDVMVLLMPMPYVWRLKMSMRRKVAIIATFGVGAIVCIASAMRIRTLRAFMNGADRSYDMFAYVFWTVVELNLAIVVSCVPALNAFFHRYIPSLLGKSYSSDQAAFQFELSPQGCHGSDPGSAGKCKIAMHGMQAYVGDRSEDDLQNNSSSIAIESAHMHAIATRGSESDLEKGRGGNDSSRDSIYRIPSKDSSLGRVTTIPSNVEVREARVQSNTPQRTRSRSTSVGTQGGRSYVADNIEELKKEEVKSYFE